nr:Arm DNA-binding domain-containing protein [Variovorax paradoxus]
MGQLNELQIKAAEPRDKEYLLADGEGLYLRIRPAGKVWVYRYKQGGKEAKLSLGALSSRVTCYRAQEGARGGGKARRRHRSQRGTPHRGGGLLPVS